TVHIPGEIVVPCSQGTLRSDAIAIFQNLVSQAPQRGANRHGSQFATGVLERIGLTSHLIDLCQAGIEHTPKVDVAGAATSGEDDGFSRTDAHSRLGAGNVPGRAVAL